MLTQAEQDLVTAVDIHLDERAGSEYQDQPLAQDWARVAKLGEEIGEVIDALIGYTSQNPRKGMYGTQDDMLKELCDVTLTGVFAIQHFTKNAAETNRLLTEHLTFLKGRVDKFNDAS